MTLQELSERVEPELRRRGIAAPGGRASAVPNARTIRWYTTLGLVDKPLGYPGGVADYGDRHLLQLLAIKALQAQFLPLEEIQSRLLGRGDAELRRILEGAVARAPRRPEPKAWHGLEAVPGLVLLVQDREALRRWMAEHPPEERAALLGDALESLTGR